MHRPDNLGYGRNAQRTKTLLIICMITFFSQGISEGTELSASGNLIEQEMHALDTALKVTVDAMVLNDPRSIVSAFHEVNQIREQVEQAVRAGTGITLPRNQKRFKEFVRLDNKFHRDVDILLTAARKNNMMAVQRQTHRLLDGCVRCHRIFRR